MVSKRTLSRWMVICILSYGGVAANTCLAEWRLEKVADYDSSYFEIDGVPFVFSSCVAAKGETIMLLNTINREVVTIGPELPVTRAIALDEVEGLGIVGGMWGNSEQLIFSLSGRKHGLVRYNFLSNGIEDLDLETGIFDIATCGPWMVVVPLQIPAPGVERTRAFLFSEGRIDSMDFGDPCPVGANIENPLLEIACLNRVAVDSLGIAYFGSLNSGQCDAVTLAEGGQERFRQDDPNWTRPKAKTDSRVVFEKAILDIEVGKPTGPVFVLTSPKGKFGERVLEIYEVRELVAVIRIDFPCDELLCGEEKTISLIKDEQPQRIIQYRYACAP